MAETGASAWNFYLMGREERRLIKHEIDVAALAKRLVADNHPRDDRWKDLLTEQCRAAAKQVSTRSRNDWLRENADEISGSGMTETEAYDAYLAGRVDELHYALEESLIEAIAASVEDTASIH